MSSALTNPGLTNPGAIIEIHDLRKTYKVGKVDVTALRGVDLKVKRGEFLAIVGPSGSGKSTLFNIIGGLTPPTTGTVRVADQDLGALTDAGRTQLRKRTVGFVFQKFNLLPNLTARDNIAIARYIAGTPSKPSAEFEEVLRLLSIANRLDHKPNALSGGEQQRIAIARAIVNHPAILLADEPTGNLDTENSTTVLGILRDLNERLGQTILMITHNPEAAAYAHHIIYMRDGRIVEPSSQ
jgi:putative ABC transport system ATP-binding protein